ncbi:hypothetical protein M231_03678 [Tremella mesenterica]|uniref:Uncharacterized protein n=1 Tax=Tremella mesenterica TaxID=5217 RepID=A0A4Q1BMK6_TREME|nr:hypothetical protein M231_03678 [Tremella mesenterica]
MGGPIGEPNQIFIPETPFVTSANTQEPLTSVHSPISKETPSSRMSNPFARSSSSKNVIPSNNTLNSSDTRNVSAKSDVLGMITKPFPSPTPSKIVTEIVNPSSRPSTSQSKKDTHGHGHGHGHLGWPGGSKRGLKKNESIEMISLDSKIGNKEEMAVERWREWILKQPPETLTNPVLLHEPLSLSFSSSISFQPSQLLSPISHSSTEQPPSPQYLSPSTALSPPTQYLRRSINPPESSHTPDTPITTTTRRRSLSNSLFPHPHSNSNQPLRTSRSSFQTGINRNINPKTSISVTSTRSNRLEEHVIYNTESTRGLRDVELAIDPNRLNTSLTQTLSNLPRIGGENAFVHISERMGSKKVRPIVLELIQSLAHFIDSVWYFEHPGEVCPWVQPEIFSIPQHSKSIPLTLPNTFPTLPQVPVFESPQVSTLTSSNVQFSPIAIGPIIPATTASQVSYQKASQTVPSMTHQSHFTSEEPTHSDPSGVLGQKHNSIPNLWYSRALTAVQIGKLSGHVPLTPTITDIRFNLSEVKYALDDVNQTVGNTQKATSPFMRAVTDGGFGHATVENVGQGRGKEKGMLRLLNDLEEVLWGDSPPRSTDFAYELPKDFDPYSTPDADRLDSFPSSQPSIPSKTSQSNQTLLDLFSPTLSPTSQNQQITNPGDITMPELADFPDVELPLLHPLQTVEDKGTNDDLGLDPSGASGLSLEEIGRRRHRAWLESREKQRT